MSSLKAELIALALEKGASVARVTTKERLAGPPSADPTYVLPEAQSVIAFAVGFDRGFLPDYFGKVSRLGFKYANYHTYQALGAIGRDLVAYLRDRGFKAVSPSPNTIYRPESTHNHKIPDFSHRLAALASGLGTLGWSGNILIPEFRSAAFLCSVVTDAQLEPDEPLAEELCDKCKLCTLVCPTQFFSAKETQAVVLGGREYVSAKKRGHARCEIGCGGFTGLSKDGKWSTWSTGRVELPDDDEALPEVFEKALLDPANAHLLASRQRRAAQPNGVLDRPLEDTNPTCCNCALMCSGPREWREKLMKLLHSSGVVVRTDDGRELVIKKRPLKSRPVVAMAT